MGDMHEFYMMYDKNAIPKRKPENYLLDMNPLVCSLISKTLEQITVWLATILKMIFLTIEFHEFS